MDVGVALVEAVDVENKMMKKIKITIKGMHCASCGANVERSLSKIGAKNINVNVIMGKAFAELDDRIAEDKIKKAVSDAGFSVEKIEGV